jgi:hypothetical protein
MPQQALGLGPGHDCTSAAASHNSNIRVYLLVSELPAEGIVVRRPPALAETGSNAQERQRPNHLSTVLMTMISEVSPASRLSSPPGPGPRTTGTPSPASSRLRIWSSR